jgi:uncharacterized protein with PQ loop repeat
VAWLGAQLPQVAENYVNQSVEGLSLYFLLNWFLGDATNLLGCVLTHQLPFQTALSTYYVCIDLVLATQYVYYSNQEHRRKILLPPDHMDAATGNLTAAPASTLASNPLAIPHHYPHNDFEDLVDDDDQAGPEAEPPTDPQDGTASPRWGWERTTRGLSGIMSASFVASFSRVRAAPVGSYVLNVYTDTNDAGNRTRTSLHADSTVILGHIFAWICAISYLTSRMPQIYKNWRRKSTWGTATLLFCAALTGNVTYTLSILLSPEVRAPQGHAFLLNELPFLVGSAGTVCFDLAILFQRLYYGKLPPVKKHLPLPKSADANYSPLPQDRVFVSSGPREIIHRHHRHDEQSSSPSVVNDMSPLGMSLQTNYNSSY